MLNADPEFELMTETDKWRFIAFVMLEIQLKKPVPLNEEYLKRKGFDLKKRPISLTIKMLHNFVECVTELSKVRTLELEEELEKDKESKDEKFVTEFFGYFLLKTKKAFKLTPTVRILIRQRLKQGFTIEQMRQAVDNFIQDDWSEREKHLDLVYCIGVRNKIDNLDKWLNYKPKKEIRYD